MSCGACGNSGCSGTCGLNNDGLSCNFAQVKTACPPDKCVSLALDGTEVCLFDSVVQEQIDIIGTPIEFWHQDIAGAVRDPLYDEPLQREWRGPWKMKAFVEYIPGVAEMREEGFRVTWNGTMFIARKTLEDLGAPSPLEGDVIRYWSNKFFQEHATGGKNDPGGDYYFDVINVDDDQHVFDSANFVGFKLTLARRTEFSAERKLGVS